VEASWKEGWRVSDKQGGCLPVTLTLTPGFGLTWEVTGEGEVGGVDEGGSWSSRQSELGGKRGLKEGLPVTLTLTQTPGFGLTRGVAGEAVVVSVVEQVSWRRKKSGSVVKEKVEELFTGNPNPNPNLGFWFDPGSCGRRRSRGRRRRGELKLESSVFGWSV
jgi:hypothetical protein